MQLTGNCGNYGIFYEITASSSDNLSFNKVLIKQVTGLEPAASS